VNTAAAIAITAGSTSRMFGRLHVHAAAAHEGTTGPDHMLAVNNANPLLPAHPERRPTPGKFKRALTVSLWRSGRCRRSFWLHNGAWEPPHQQPDPANFLSINSRACRHAVQPGRRQRLRTDVDHRDLHVQVSTTTAPATATLPSAKDLVVHSDSPRFASWWTCPVRLDAARHDALPHPRVGKHRALDPGMHHANVGRRLEWTLIYPLSPVGQRFGLRAVGVRVPLA
jgi:hypothetical protein